MDWRFLVIAWLVASLIGVVLHWAREYDREQREVDELLRRWRDQ